MYKDAEGFYYPQTGAGCLECGLCLAVCPLKSRRGSTTSFSPRYLGVKAKDSDILAYSTSGGLFTLLSDAVFARHGFIYGAVFDSEMNLSHIEASEPSVRNKMRGAKYLQSDPGETYKKVKARLDEGRYVMFTGTPCQVEALKRYLHAEYERLLCVDLICNGVPSPGVFHHCLRILERKGKIEHFNFRDKRRGWHNSMVSYVRGGEKIYETFGENLFTSLYFRDLITRPVCAVCPYANLNRPGDITIGDFWGIEKVNPRFDDTRGVSLCILNNAKGQAFFEAVIDGCDYFECRTKDDFLQPRLVSPPMPSPGRGRFFKSYMRWGIYYLRVLALWHSMQGTVRLIYRKCHRLIARMMKIGKASMT